MDNQAKIVIRAQVEVPAAMVMEPWADLKRALGLSKGESVLAYRQMASFWFCLCLVWMKCSEQAVWGLKGL